ALRTADRARSGDRSLMRVALVHDWLTGMRGGERVLERLIQLFPSAELFTLVHIPGAVSPTIEARPIHASWLNRMPRIARTYRYYLPLMPRAVEQFDLRGFDLVISSSHCVAKGVRVPANVPHLCYCHTPMRYLYDQADAYTSRWPWPVRTSLNVVSGRLRRWDIATARRVQRFIANSTHVRERIRSIYRRDATVIHPPVDVDRVQPAARREDYYATVSALVPYKRVDLLVSAFNRLGRRLLVVGSGPEQSRLARMARPNITFTGRITDAEVAQLLSRARAFVFAGVEDFGIAMVEAQAAGTPVIAFAAGGALETVVDAPGAAATGVLFRAQTPESIMAAVMAAEGRTFQPAMLQQHARAFRPERFLNALRAEVDMLLAGAPPELATA
ncbi:MAG TPA: glycosyltransferase, partial [Longimicrobiales bacterium]|nr:glycosyltransferase [Longimicrobiales bacterium]